MRICFFSVVCALLAAPAFATITFTNSTFANNDQVSWSQLGPDPTSIPQSFTATSTGLLSISGLFGGTNGGQVVTTPGSWPATAGSFNSGDTVLWTGDSLGGSNGPLTLSFPAVIRAGLWLQADQPGQFTAQITAYEGLTSLSTTFQSNANGDPIFLGAFESSNAALITKLTFVLTTCGGGTCPNVNDFAVDTLFLTTGATVPEPGTLGSLAAGLFLAGLCGRYSKKARRRL